MEVPVWLTSRQPQHHRSWTSAVANFFVRYRWLLFALFVLSAGEMWWHNTKYTVTRPSKPLDEPFQYGCQEPDVSPSAPRENAAIVMLGRNKDLSIMIPTLQTFDRVFNHWAKYPIVFLNDEPWDPRVIEAVQAEVSGNATFDTIDSSLWGIPDFLDKERAEDAMEWQGAHGVKYGASAGYHHMCRFYSGKFYDHPALKPYKWYWRVDADVKYTSAITYDPFVAMAQANKTYGYTIAFGELKVTVPSLFKEISAYKRLRNLPTTNLWKSMIDPAWVPWPMRELSRLSPWPIGLYDSWATSWNGCHMWSNFEIADMDFFRSQAYRDFFDHLDHTGGFYYERWGDASVHALALALFLEPQQLHHFADIGYSHDDQENCPLPSSADETSHHEDESASLQLTSRTSGSPQAVGCRTSCDPNKPKLSHMKKCLRQFRLGVDPL